MSVNTIATCRQGSIQGYFTGRCLLFAGLPYAQPPVGQLRFQPPQPPLAWQGIRDATQFGPMQPQRPSRFRRFHGANPESQSEDSLTLNIWTPDIRPANRPVIVYIHGGAWISGSGAMPLYHGASFASDHGVVAVTLNYRLAELGNLYLGHLDPDFAASGNHALLDQVAALEWIRDNIAAFGGDPGNVTVFGESAGAHYVLALMTSPRSQSLFHRAISHSAASLAPLRTIAEATQTSERFFAEAGITSINELRAMSTEQLLTARHATMQAIPSRRTIWGALVDGEIVPEQPVQAASGGRLAAVPLLIGDCGEDFRPFVSVIPRDKHPQNRGQLEQHLTNLGVDGVTTAALYQDYLQTTDVTELYIAAMTDFYRQTSICLAEKHSHWRPTYFFRFDWQSPVQDGAMGAGHTVVQPFAFNNLWTPSTPFLLGNHPPIWLAETMNAAWSNFASSGEPSGEQLPPWPSYTADQRAVMVFADPLEMQIDPDIDRRLLWSKLPIFAV